MIVILGFGMLSFPHQRIVSTQLQFFLHVATALTSSEPEAKKRVLWFAVKVVDAHFF